MSKNWRNKKIYCKKKVAFVSSKENIYLPSEEALHYKVSSG